MKHIETWYGPGQHHTSWGFSTGMNQLVAFNSCTVNSKKKMLKQISPKASLFLKVAFICMYFSAIEEMLFVNESCWTGTSDELCMDSMHGIRPDSPF